MWHWHNDESINHTWLIHTQTPLTFSLDNIAVTCLLMLTLPLMTLSSTLTSTTQWELVNSGRKCRSLFKRLNFWHWRRVWCKYSAFLDYICQTDVIVGLMQRLKVNVKKQEKHTCLGAFVCVSLTSICVGKLWQTVSSNVCVGLSLHISTSSRSMSPLIRSPLATRPILITPHNKPPPLDSL